MSIMETQDDRELVTAYLAGEEGALPILINRKTKAVYRFVFGLVGNEFLAEDITQEVFMKMWRKLKSYNSQYTFNTWLFSIARNTAIDSLRKRKELVFSDLENADQETSFADNLVDPLPLAESVFDQKADIAQLMKTLKEIPLIYREVLLLRYTDYLSFGEIAETLKRPIETIKSQHRRGLLHLKTQFNRIHKREK